MDESTNVQAWCYGLPDLFEHEAAIRLALEFAWRAELTWRTVVPPTDLSPAIFAELVDRPRRALETFDEFLCGSASGESLAVAHSLLEEVSREWGDPFGEPIEEGPEGVKWEALGYVARFCDLPGHLYATPLCCEDYVEEFTSVGTFVGHVLYESLFSRTDFAASKTELSRWALGYCDPVRERVQARQRDAARE
ncbi:MAG: hypothetical protein JKY65_04140 [Planctomycetes bacterium]|nr:hypothetical protein [Planctomycetota bacterium]